MTAPTHTGGEDTAWAGRAAREGIEYEGEDLSTWKPEYAAQYLAGCIAIILKHAPKPPPTPAGEAPELLFSQRLVPVLTAERDELRAALAAAKQEVGESERELADYKRTVTKIWDALGNPPYESLNGKTIWEVVAKLAALQGKQGGGPTN